MRQKIVTFGEIMLRMTRPEKLRIIQGSTWDGYFGGSEANVAVSLAMLGNDVEYVTRLPDNKLGQACLNELRKYNVGTRFVTRGGIRLGTYYYENAAAMRGSSVVYDRADSSMTTVAKGTINWADAFADASVFHWSGISCALSRRYRRGRVRGRKTGPCNIFRHKLPQESVEIRQERPRHTAAAGQEMRHNVRHRRRMATSHGHHSAEIYCHVACFHLRHPKP